MKVNHIDHEQTRAPDSAVIHKIHQMQAEVPHQVTSLKVDKMNFDTQTGNTVPGVLRQIAELEALVTTGFSIVFGWKDDSYPTDSIISGLNHKFCQYFGLFLLVILYALNYMFLFSVTGVVVMCVVCAGFIFVLVVLGIARIRNARRHIHTVNVEEKQEMEWDNSALTITVNPMDQEV